MRFVRAETQIQVLLAIFFQHPQNDAWCVQVYLASASPPVRFPNVYGVDMPTRKEFVAADLTEPEICKVKSS